MSSSLTSEQSMGHFIFLRHTVFSVAIVTQIALAVERPNGVVARGLQVTQMPVLQSYVVGGIRNFIILVFNAFVDICIHKKRKNYTSPTTPDQRTLQPCHATHQKAMSCNRPEMKSRHATDFLQFSTIISILVSMKTTRTSLENQATLTPCTVKLCYADGHFNLAKSNKAFQVISGDEFDEISPFTY